jgi:hypothetical protein
MLPLSSSSFFIIVVEWNGGRDGSLQGVELAPLPTVELVLGPALTARTKLEERTTPGFFPSDARDPRTSGVATIAGVLMPEGIANSLSYRGGNVSDGEGIHG